MRNSVTNMYYIVSRLFYRKQQLAEVATLFKVYIKVSPLRQI